MKIDLGLPEYLLNITTARMMIPKVKCIATVVRLAHMNIALLVRPPPEHIVREPDTMVYQVRYLNRCSGR